jgi:hypothetical protein
MGGCAKLTGIMGKFIPFMGHPGVLLPPGRGPNIPGMAICGMMAGAPSTGVKYVPKLLLVIMTGMYMMGCWAMGALVGTGAAGVEDGAAARKLTDCGMVTGAGVGSAGGGPGMVGETPPSFRGRVGTTILADGMVRMVSAASTGFTRRTGDEARFAVGTCGFAAVTAVWWVSYDDAVKDISMFMRYKDFRNFSRNSSRLMRDASMAEMTSGNDRITGLITEYICCSIRGGGKTERKADTRELKVQKRAPGRSPFSRGTFWTVASSDSVTRPLNTSAGL